MLRRAVPGGAPAQLRLLTGPLGACSELGARPVPAAEVHAVADAAVDTFLRAYRPDR